MRSMRWLRCRMLKICSDANADTKRNCIYPTLSDTGGNSSYLSLKVVVPSLSNNKILIRISSVILFYPWEFLQACITLQAYFQILVSAKDALDFESKWNDQDAQAASDINCVKYSSVESYAEEECMAGDSSSLRLMIRGTTALKFIISSSLEAADRGGHPDETWKSACGFS